MIGFLGAAAIGAIWLVGQRLVDEGGARLATVRAADLCNDLSLEHRDCMFWSSLSEAQRLDPWGHPMGCLAIGTSFAVVTFGSDKAAGGTGFAYDQYCSPTGHNLGKRCTCRFGAPIPQPAP